jgi:hypothetical protein
MAWDKKSNDDGARSLIGQVPQEWGMVPLESGTRW